jgi:hypothetical protein
VELLRNNRRLSNAQKGLAIHGAFPATFQGQSINKSDSEKKLPCLCREHHWYKECPYLVESVRTKNWKPNPSIQENLRLKETIDRIRKEQQEKPSPTDQSTLSVFTVSNASATTSDYHLRDSFILDSGATLRVCNDRTRFQDIRPTLDEELLYAGNAVIPIEGFVPATITIQAPEEPRPIADGSLKPAIRLCAWRPRIFAAVNDTVPTSTPAMTSPQKSTVIPSNPSD